VIIAGSLHHRDHHRADDTRKVTGPLTRASGRENHPHGSSRDQAIPGKLAIGTPPSPTLGYFAVKLFNMLPGSTPPSPLPA
jgi:hypothetical protein